MATLACGWCENAPWRVECAQCNPHRPMRLCAACAARWHARGVAKEHEVTDMTGAKRPYRDWASSAEDTQARNAATNNGRAEKAARAQLQVNEAAGNAHRAAAPDSTVGQNDSLSDAGGPDATKPDISSIPIASIGTRTKLAELNALARRFPTTDARTHAAMVAMVLRAVRHRDALLCATTNKCEQPPCVRALAAQKRYNAVKGRYASEAGVEEDDEMQWAIAFTSHVDGCATTMCPFCIHVNLRTQKSLIAVLDLMLKRRRQQLARVPEDTASESTISDAVQRAREVENRRRNLTKIVSEMEQRQQRHTDMAIKLQHLQRQNALQGFSFPPFNWHLNSGVSPESSSTTTALESLAVLENDIDAFSGAPDCRSLPGANELDAAAATAPATAPQMDASEKEMATAIAETEDETLPIVEVAAASSGDQPDEVATMPEADVAQPDADSKASKPDGIKPDEDAKTSEPDAAQPDEATVHESGFIDTLLAAKQASPGDASARDAFEEALALGCSIVDAGFCSPTRASRCLLRCQTILTHLQHHVDLNVCSDSMCEAVEHHFAHLSQCRSRSSNVTCEYCLRVEEREHGRLVEALEMEQPEADARVQSVINAMTDSLTDDPPAEREQAIMQLEDELEQAEEEKRRLAEKLSAERLELRRVRRRLDRDGFFSPASSSERLPPHFVKVLK